MKFHLSFFKNVYDNGADKDAIPSEVLSWEEIITRATNPTLHGEKEEAGLWNGARYGNKRKGGKEKDKNSLRHQDNVIENSLLMLDYDDGETFAEGVAFWEDMECAFLAHTSFSHKPEHHKFRVLIPLVSPIPGNQYSALWDYFNRSTEERVDHAPKSITSMFYVPSHHPAGEYFVHVGEGDFLDWSKLELEQKQAEMQSDPPPRYTADKDNPQRCTPYLTKLLNGIAADVAAIQTNRSRGLLNKTMRAAGFLHYGVFTEGDILDQMAAATRGWENQKKTQGTIKRAIRYGAAKPLYILENPDWKPPRTSARMRGTQNKTRLTAEATTETDSEIKAIVAEINAQIEDDGMIDFGFTDLGFVNRFYLERPDDFLYVLEWDKWVAWSGQKWEAEHGEALLWEAMRACSLRCSYAESKNNEKAAEKIHKFFAKYRGANGLAQAAKMASRDMRFRRSSEQFDLDIWLLNCQNGTLNLKTGELLPFDRSHLITKQIEVAYDADAKAQRWQDFLATVFPDDGTRAFVQRAAGYSITGSVREQALFICYGGGSNGKSTFIEAIEHILAPYHVKAGMNTFSMKQGDNTSDLARMRGSRFVTVSENDDNTKLSEGLIKMATGDTRITARLLYQNPFTYAPTFKVWMCVNHQPVITGTDEGIWRRPKLIPFIVKIEDKDKDRNLGTTLKGEAAGILTWLVEGCKQWNEDGLELSEKVIEATQKYREEMDTLGRFIEEVCEVDSSRKLENICVLSNSLYRAYAHWCKESGEYARTNTWFGRQLTDRGFPSKMGSDGRKSRTFINIRAEEQERQNNQDLSGKPNWRH